MKKLMRSHYAERRLAERARINMACATGKGNQELLQNLECLCRESVNGVDALSHEVLQDLKMHNGLERPVAYCLAYLVQAVIR